ncbi:hypothetical protein [Stratiformator vulcanicus]|uniref:hypothetical protein n=1 Tax=Stratiformator vulcanicus TaxID=2527980 RepID=UPI00287770C4|nr:hypothetical protein [Stratiformator vulcanicus]
MNCPFDADYRPIFDAILFAIYDCGFRPRCALEDEDSSQIRVHKIRDLIGTSQFAIHDISRVQMDAISGFPRFNMPLELGMFLGAKWFGAPPQDSKNCLILDTERYRFQQFLSDISGQDIRAHDDDPNRAVTQIRNWLNTFSQRRLPSARRIISRYEAFRKQWVKLARKLSVDEDEPTFRDVEELIYHWLDQNPLRGRRI